MIIKFEENLNQASVLIQNNSNGVSFVKISEYFNDKIECYHQNINKDKIRYRVYTNNIVSSDFLLALEKTSRIKTVKLVVDGEDINVSEFKKISKMNDINESIDIILKPPKRGGGISSDTVKEFFKLYNIENKRIKRIYIDSEGAEKNLLSFDIEKMKQREFVEVSESITGEPDIEDLKNVLKSKILAY